MNAAIKPQINAHGFRTAVKDYKEKSVVEELAANAHDEKASAVVVSTLVPKTSRGEFKLIVLDQIFTDK